MKTKYLCPNCKLSLNIDDDIVLMAKNKKGEKGLVLLHTELGNYSSKKSDSFHIEISEAVDFFCPLCNKSIDYKFKVSYANLIQVTDKENQVIFSKIYGQKSTFKVEGKVVTTYGEHAIKYTDPEWFL
ncbi:MAG: hypothetical protein HQ542_03340 [Bacteroidia bacterium]|nr:hypothetical protein [Bacteroidia bacterium]